MDITTAKYNKYLKKSQQLNNNESKINLYNAKLNFYSQQLEHQIGGDAKENAKRKFGASIFNYLKLYVSAEDANFFNNPQTSKQNYRATLRQLVMDSNHFSEFTPHCADPNVANLINRLFKLEYGDKRVTVDKHTPSIMSNDPDVFFPAIKDITAMCVKLYIRNSCDIYIRSNDREGTEAYSRKIDESIDKLYPELTPQYEQQRAPRHASEQRQSRHAPEQRASKDPPRHASEQRQSRHAPEQRASKDPPRHASEQRPSKDSSRHVSERRTSSNSSEPDLITDLNNLSEKLNTTMTHVRSNPGANIVPDLNKIKDDLNKIIGNFSR